MQGLGFGTTSGAFQKFLRYTGPNSSTFDRRYPQSGEASSFRGSDHCFSNCSRCLFASRRTRASSRFSRSVARSVSWSNICSFRDQP